MRGLWVIAAVAVGMGGCTTVKVVQRDGCWVRQTKKLGATKEELGPCAAPAPAWSDDRLTRLVQECSVRADQRWRTLAISAFQRHVPPPERGGDEAVLAACVDQAARLGAVENADLRERLAEAEQERGRLRERAEREHAALAARAEKDHEAFVARDAKERDALAESAVKLADWLGQAAAKPAQPAVATATASSDGRARTESEQQQPAPAALVAQPWAPAGAAPAEAVVSFRAEPAAPAACAAPDDPARAPAARRGKAARLAKVAALKGCEIPAPAGDTPAPATPPAPAGPPPAAPPTLAPAAASTGTGSAAP